MTAGESDFERWIYVLKNMEHLQRIPFKTRKAVFDRLEKIVDIASLTKEEREMYDHSIKQYRDTMAVMKTERNVGFMEGERKGREEKDYTYHLLRSRAKLRTAFFIHSTLAIHSVPE